MLGGVHSYNNQENNQYGAGREARSSFSHNRSGGGLPPRTVRPLRRPRVHSGSADDYFERNPQGSQLLKVNPNRGGRSLAFDQLSGGKWIHYLYWLAGGLAAIALIYLLGSFLKSSGVSANLVYQEGEVQVKKGGSDEWKAVETDTKLKKLDEVKTMAGARAIVNFEDGTILRLDSYSRVILNSEKGKIIVIQTDGSSYHRVAKDENRTYEVQLSGLEGTQAPTVTATGTAFWVGKTGASDIVVGVLEGAVNFSQPANSEALELDEGQKMAIDIASSSSGSGKEEVTADDLRGDFLNWNIEQDRKKELAISSFVRLKLAEEVTTTEEKTEAGTEETKPEEETKAEGIVLTGNATATGVVLTWALNGVTAPNGLKIVKGTTANPEYPGSYYRSVRSSETTTYTWDVVDGATHHFRICVYDGSTGCSTYSNDLEVKAEKVDTSALEEKCTGSDGDWDDDTSKCDCPDNYELSDGKCVKDEEDVDEEEECTDSGGTWDDDDEECTCPDDEELDDYRCVAIDYASSVSLSGSSKDAGEVTLKWSFSGGSAPNGFKIVRSKSKNPIYPDDVEKSISSSSTASYTLEDQKKGETYYYRVCVWDGDKCKVYSNNEEVKVDKE